MSQAQRDENEIVVGLAYDGTTTQPLLVDPSTGRLLIEVAAISSGSPTVNTNFSRDENDVPVAGADDGTNPIPLHICVTSGFLSVDLTT